MKSAMLFAAAAAVGFNVLAEDPSYPQLPTERGWKVTVKGNRLCLSCVRGFQVLVY